jgi:succinate dehydrogenase hydrophobic anchor subunit
MDGLGFRHEQDRYIAQQVHMDRLHQLFRQSVSAVFGSFLAVIMLSWLCWDRFDHNVVFWWIALLTGATLIRILMFVVYFHSPAALRTRSAGNSSIG